MFGVGILYLAYFAHGCLNSVQHGQAGENPHGRGLVWVRHGPPIRAVVGQRDLLRQPEITGDAVPNLYVFGIIEMIPVDGSQGDRRVKPIVWRGRGSLADVSGATFHGRSSHPVV